MGLSKYVMLTCLLLLTASHVRAQSNVCRLTYAYLDKETGILASIQDLTTFSFAAEDQEVMKSFRHEESDTQITVAAQTSGRAGKRGRRLMGLAIAFGEPRFQYPHDLFRYADSAVAESFDKGADGWLSVSKTTETTERIYRFTFRCVGRARK